MGSKAYQRIISIQCDQYHTWDRCWLGSMATENTVTLVLSYWFWEWEEGWNRDTESDEIKMVFEVGLEGCMVISGVAKGSKSICGIENAMFEVWSHKQAWCFWKGLWQGWRADLCRALKDMFKTGLHPLRTGRYWRCLEHVLEVEAHRYMFQQPKSDMWKMVQRGDVSLQVGRPLSHPSPNPAENGAQSKALALLLGSRERQKWCLEDRINKVKF